MTQRISGSGPARREVAGGAWGLVRRPRMRSAVRRIGSVVRSLRRRAAADLEAGAGEAGVGLVDALVGVAGEEDVVGSFGCEGAQQSQLGGAEVLDLVGDDVAVGRLGGGVEPVGDLPAEVGPGAELAGLEQFADPGQRRPRLLALGAVEGDGAGDAVDVGVLKVLQAPEVDEFAGLVSQARAVARDEGLRVADVRRAVREARRKA